MQGYLISMNTANKIKNTINVVQNLPTDLTTRSENKKGLGSSSEEYLGFFSCINASTDSVLQVVVCEGSMYVDENNYGTVAGTHSVNGVVGNQVPCKKITITQSGYLYVHKPFNSSANKFEDSEVKFANTIPTLPDEDSVVIIGSVLYIPADGTIPAKIVVRQIWKWENIDDLKFVMCNIGCVV